MSLKVDLVLDIDERWYRNGVLVRCTTCNEPATHFHIPSSFEGHHQILMDSSHWLCLARCEEHRVPEETITFETEYDGNPNIDWAKELSKGYEPAKGENMSLDESDLRFIENALGVYEAEWSFNWSYGKKARFDLVCKKIKELQSSKKTTASRLLEIRKGKPHHQSSTPSTKKVVE